MNIKNRLKKIESDLNLDSEFCRCDREVVIKIEPRDENDEIPPPEVCKDCGKEVSQLFCTFNFNNNINIETELILPPYRVIEPGDVQENQI